MKLPNELEVMKKIVKSVEHARTRDFLVEYEIEDSMTIKELKDLIFDVINEYPHTKLSSEHVKMVNEMVLAEGTFNTKLERIKEL